MKNKKISTMLEFIFFILIIILSIVGVSYIPIISVAFFFLSLFLRSNNGKVILLPKNYRKYFWNIIFFVLYGTAVSIVSLLIGDLKNAESIKTVLIGSYLLLGGMSYIRLAGVDILQLLQFIKCFGVACSIYGIIEYFTRTNITFVFLSEMTRLHLTQEGRIMSFFGHPIIYSCFLSFVLLTLFYFPFNNKKIDVVSKILVVANIVFTQTRTCFLALFVLLVIILLKKRTISKRLNKKKFFWTSIILVTFGTILFIFLRDQMNVILNSLVERVGALTLENQSIRVDIINGYIRYLSSSQNFFQAIFGAGAGYSTQFVKNLYVLNGWWDTTTDNMFITILLNYGIIGIIPFIILLKNVIHMYKNDNNPFKNLGCANMIFLLLSSFTFESLGWPIIIYLFAISIVLINKKGEEKNGSFVI